MLALLRELLESLIRIGSIRLSLLILVLLGVITGITMILKKKKKSEE
ncbi:hypothetical protein SAMN04487969_106190 [Paenibacillus algorifonticola]|uniref:Uncharacterized protein n=1 Tax=Paenibacillus algorifonticola TaxID=684063 RepID=A0A1I2D8U2_9BACL|nr:hypothetical protein SAMN04487969_106190 [Paenibacillus algorifonticola]